MRAMLKITAMRRRIRAGMSHLDPVRVLGWERDVGGMVGSRVYEVYTDSRKKVCMNFIHIGRSKKSGKFIFLCIML
jgi:hypothetical protein